MPEGDAVWFTAKRLREALDDRVLTRSDFRVPRYATSDLSGRIVLTTEPRGKHMLTRVEGGLTIHTHLRMDGSWRILPPAARPPGRDVVRLILANASHQAVGFKLGIVELLRTADEHKAVGHLGPDLLGPLWDPAAAVANLASLPERTIGEALLDQRNLAGLGTIWRAETLFMSRLNPWVPTGDIPDLSPIVAHAHRLLTDAITRPTRDKWVYGRARMPCRRCGTPVRRGEMGPEPYERNIFWCPRCQPGAGPPAATFDT